MENDDDDLYSEEKNIELIDKFDIINNFHSNIHPYSFKHNSINNIIKLQFDKISNHFIHQLNKKIKNAVCYQQLDYIYYRIPFFIYGMPKFNPFQIMDNIIIQLQKKNWNFQLLTRLSFILFLPKLSIDDIKKSLLPINPLQNSPSSSFVTNTTTTTKTTNTAIKKNIITSLPKITTTTTYNNNNNNNFSPIVKGNTLLNNLKNCKTKLLTN